MDNYGANLLPPMPPSDSKSLQWNKKDNYYDVKAREFWGKSRISSEEVKDFKECEHFFSSKNGGVECKKCHMGLYGIFEISKGKLYYKGDLIKI